MLKALLIRISFFLGFWLLCLSSWSQESSTNRIWLDFIPHFKINEDLEYYGDAGYRIILSEDIHTFVIRPSIRYHLNPLVELRGGIGFFYTIDPNFSNQFEIRPWQGVRLNWPTFGRIGIKHYLRLEERLLWATDDWNFDPALRLRYKLGFRIPFNETRTTYLSLFGEAFANGGGQEVEQFRNRMRVYLGFGYRFDQTWRMEIEYIGQASRSNDVEDFDLADNIYRLRVFKGGWVW